MNIVSRVFTLFSIASAVRFTQRPVFFLFALLAALLLSGCAGSGGKRLVRVGEDVYIAIDVPEETISEPGIPTDDSEPLSRAEFAALHSKGELDGNLSATELRLVELHFKSFVRNPQSFERQLKRSELFLPYVKEVFKKRGLPEELAYLAFVESSFNPNAVSRAGACGMWQFMPYTGKLYGLGFDRWHDERRDPFKATEAAAAYLTKLHNDFNDWHLAIAAYNAGEGKIGRALSGTGATSFFEICRRNKRLDHKARLREETLQYVPRFLAVAKIMRNLDTLGFDQPDPRKALTVATVTLPAGVDLRQFAQAIDVDWSQFTGLNPAYRRSISPPNRATKAYVPQARGGRATVWASGKSAGLYAGWRDYKVRNRDSLGLIAHRTGTTTAMLRRANSKPNNTLRTGEILLVPGSSYVARQTLKKLDPETRSSLTAVNTRRLQSTGKHTVVKGDTLFGLSRQYGISIDDLCDINGINFSNSLRIGQSILIPGSAPEAAATKTVAIETTPQAKPVASLVDEARVAARNGSMYHTVKEGDTLYTLARANNCTVADLCKLNNISTRTSLRIGQQLRLMPGGQDLATAEVQKKAPPVKTTAEEAKAVVVQSGDTLYSLARGNNTSVAAISKLNGIDPRTPLRLGQVIQIP